MKLKFYLDKRAVKKGEVAPLKLSIAHNNGTALLPLDINILPSQFNPKTERVEKHPNQSFINTFLSQRKNEVEKIALELSMQGRLGAMTATELKNFVKTKINNTADTTDSENFSKNIDALIAAKHLHPHTIESYKYTLQVLEKFHKNAKSLKLSDMSVKFLKEFDDYMTNSLKMKPNSRSMVLTKIRSVFNYAISQDVTAYYPFKKFKFKSYTRTPKRALTIDQLRMLINMPLPAKTIPIRDYFLLTFCLIGINAADLLRLSPSAISNQNRLEYVRAKTGKPYSIKIEPETEKLLKKYKGQKFLLNFADTAENKIHQFASNLDVKLKKLMPSIPNFSLYWARHTWATIAAGLDIPKETIARALGHGSNTVTDIYIDFDERKVDKANRQVLDYVFYGKQDNTTEPTK